MKAVVTTVKHSTRFFLTPEGMATDIFSRAWSCEHSHDATMRALSARLELAWEGFAWEPACILTNGEIVLSPLVKAQGKAE